MANIYSTEKNKQGFTLVELSIVLVIIGLLIGGILVGQSLIESARINSQIRQFQQYDIAITQFKDKFKQIPGDSNLGFYNSDATTSIATAPNNNGYINSGATTSPPTEKRSEPLMFFVHLSHSGMISDSHDLRNEGSSGTPYCIGKGQEWPKADIGEGGLGVSGTPNSDIYYILGIREDCTTQIWSHTTTYNVTPMQALALDKKTDDGAAWSGNVVSIRTGGVVGDGAPYPFVLNSAGGASCSPSGVYNTSLGTMVCALIVKSKYKN